MTKMSIICKIANCSSSCQKAFRISQSQIILCTLRVTSYPNQPLIIPVGGTKHRHKQKFEKAKPYVKTKNRCLTRNTALP